MIVRIIISAICIGTVFILGKWGNDRIKKFKLVMEVASIIVSLLLVIFPNNNDTKEEKINGQMNNASIEQNQNNGTIINQNNGTVNTYVQMPNNSNVDQEKLFPEKPEFEKLENEKYNFQMKYPKHFIRSNNFDSDNTDLYYQSLDKKASLQLIARKYDPNKKLDESFTISSIKNDPNNVVITCDDKTDDEGWYVINYKTDRNFGFVKCMMDGENVRKLIFVYPLDQYEMYHDNYNYVEVIEENFIRLREK